MNEREIKTLANIAIAYKVTSRSSSGELARYFLEVAAKHAGKAKKVFDDLYDDILNFDPDKSNWRKLRKAIKEAQGLVFSMVSAVGTASEHTDDVEKAGGFVDRVFSMEIHDLRVRLDDFEDDNGIDTAEGKTLMWDDAAGFYKDDHQDATSAVMGAIVELEGFAVEIEGLLENGSGFVEGFDH